jgi:futalosine hydrolase
VTSGVERVLVVAATERELAPSAGWPTLCCGVGPVDAAARTAVAIERHRPLAIVHLGIAGARRATAIQPPALVVGIESIYSDLGVPEEWAPERIGPPAFLIEAAVRALPSLTRCRIGTSGRVGRTTGCEVEAMEGFAVLRAAAIAGVPAIEVRAISNTIEEPDRSHWRFSEAFDAIVRATPMLVAEVAACVG